MSNRMKSGRDLGRKRAKQALLILRVGIYHTKWILYIIVPGIYWCNKITNPNFI